VGVLYTAVVACTFLFTSIVFVVFAYVVELRQNIVMHGVLKSAKQVATTERELNEFLAHEVRNPLSAAMSALSFVTSTINETAYISNEEFKVSLREDAQIISSSLRFIDDFLRSLLDMYRAAANKLEIKSSNPRKAVRAVFVKSSCTRMMAMIRSIPSSSCRKTSLSSLWTMTIYCASCFHVPW
jgi:signal transduction histidine kinase